MGALRSATRVAALTVALTAAAIATASPSGATPGHKSCKDLGALTAAEAHAGILVAEIHGLPHGTFDDLIAAVQVGGTFGGEPVPAFCTPR